MEFWTKLEGSEDGIGDAGRFNSGVDIVNADDVRTAKDSCGVCGDGCVEALGDGWRRVGEGVADMRGREGMGEEALAGEADEDRSAEGLQGAETGEKRVVFVAELSEAEAGIEDDSVERDAGSFRGLKTSAELVADERLDGDGVEAWKRVPLLRGSAGVHEDEAGRRISVGEGVGHRGVPCEAADVVDDLGSGVDGEACRGAVVGVDGEDGLRARLANGFKDGKEAGLLFGGRDDFSVGAGRFGTDIEDVCALVKEIETVLDCRV